MALPAGVTRLGSFKGKDGDKGDTGSLAYADGELVGWNEGFDVTMVGPESNRGAYFKVPMPLPTPATVNNDDATEALLLNPTKTQEAARAITVPVRKRIHGGVMPEPLRVPALGIQAVYPSEASPYVVCWAEGATLYGYGRESTLRKSTDNGATWAKVGYNAYGFSAYGCFLKLASGTLLNIAGGTPPTIQRSTNDGATWTNVHTFRTSTVPLGSQSWCVDPTTGDIYYGEYFTMGTADIAVWRSTDDGATWSILATWPGELTPVGTLNRIRHIHAVQWDHVAERVIVCTGDSTPATGIWRTTADGTGVEAVVTNGMLPAELLDAPRSIGVIPFPDYIAWASDSTLSPYLFRMNRAEIGSPTPVVETIYRMNSASWFTCKASADGSRWVVSSSPEGVGIDKMTHLYAVEDQGETVWELATVPQRDGATTGALQPIGRPEMHGAAFWLAGRFLATGQGPSYKMALGYGSSAPLPLPAPLVAVPVVNALSSAEITVGPGETKVAGFSIAPALGRRLHIFETGILTTDLGGVGAGNAKLRIRRNAAAHFFETTATSDRYSSRQEMGGSLLTELCTGGDRVEFLIHNVHGTATIKAIINVTYGWGIA